jgi:hypothetical protein
MKEISVHIKKACVRHLASLQSCKSRAGRYGAGSRDQDFAKPESVSILILDS